MARPLILSLDGQETAVSILKVDRERLYGDIEIEAFDEKGKPASIKIRAVLPWRRSMKTEIRSAGRNFGPST
jgi:hypothetical protein